MRCCKRIYRILCTMNHIKIVILSASQLLPREVEFYCLEELSTQFQLEYWDCSAFLYPNFCVPEKVVHRTYLNEIETLSQFKLKVSKLPLDTVVVTDVIANKSNYAFYKILCHYFPKHITIFFSTNAIPIKCENSRSRNIHENHQKYIWLDKIKSYLYQSFGLRRLVTYLRYRNQPNYEERVNHLYEVRIQQLCSLTIIGCNEQFAWRINHPDYERYLSLQNTSTSFNGEPYIVFIDEYYPYLKEVNMNNSEMDIEETARLYYKSMNAFFAYVEQQFNCSVVIAAHPKSDYHNHNPFKGRQIIFNKTVELIRSCEACIIHNSNCYSYVVLYDKPVAAVVNEALLRSDVFSKYIRDVNANFNVKVQNIDMSYNAPENLFGHIDENIRKQYVQTHLCVKNNRIRNSELLKQYFEEYHSELLKMKK